MTFETTKAELIKHDIKEADLDRLVQTLNRLDKKDAEQELIGILFEKKEIRAWLKQRAIDRRLKARALFLFDMSAHPDFPSAATARDMNAVFSMCSFLCVEFLPRPESEPFIPRTAPPDPLAFLM